MKRIPLTRGQFAIVDDADFEWLNQWKWYFSKVHNNEDKGYAARRIHIRLDKNKYTGKYISMHRFILSAKIGESVDHEDGDGLNNQRYNLRKCTQLQNNMNRAVQRNNKSGYKGVWWNKHKNRWEASIRLHGKNIYIGRRKTPEEAAELYNQAALKYFGEFARLNVL